MTTLSTLLDDAGLTGRGGADFRTGAKVAGAAQHGADLIVNACDGELGAAKDAWVITHHLAEMLAGAQAVTRGSIQVAASRDSPVLAQLRAQGVATLAVPRRYVASEESSLVSLAHGGLARPFMRSAPVVTGSHDRRGRRFRPTLVLNAETVWRLSQIMDRGVRWFRSFGTAAEPGPRLVTLVNGVARPGVYDAEGGSPSRSSCRWAAALSSRWPRGGSVDWVVDSFPPTRKPGSAGREPAWRRSGLRRVVAS